MRNIVFILLIGAFYSCNTGDDSPVLEFNYVESDLLGKWFDIDGCESLMQTDSSLVFVEDRDIVFTFNEDNSYDIQNKKVCLDVLNDGSWVFNEQTNMLTMEEEFVPSDSLLIFDITRKHNWEIIMLSDDTLEVIHTFIFSDTDNTESAFSLSRKFEKIE